MDPIDAIPPMGSRPQAAPAAPARVARIERDQRHPPPGQDQSPGGRAGEDQDEAPPDNDLEDFYDENWTQRFATRAQPPEDEQEPGPHIDIIA